LRRGRDARSVSWIKLAGADTMTVAAKVAEIAQQSRPDAEDFARPSLTSYNKQKKPRLVTGLAGAEV
jgi:hypothetical protein